MEDYKTNFHETEISELIDGLDPFPENVFVEEQSWLSKYLMPLISIDLGILRTDLKGTKVHMLNPTEPADGLIGQETSEFHNEFSSENWIAFKLTEENKYSFLGNENYFLSASIHKDKVDQDFTEHIKTIQENYLRIKDLYKTKNQLLPWQDNNPEDFLDILGGELWYGNWTNTSPIPSAFEMSINEDIEDIEDLPNDGISITYKDKEFMFVGEVAGYSYCKSGADAILLFYEPENRIVLFTYDWS